STASSAGTDHGREAVAESHRATARQPAGQSAPARQPGGTLSLSQPDNQRLRDNLEGLCRDPAFAGLTWFWGPRLYARSKATFRPLILNHFSEWLTSGNRWHRVAWADHAAELEAWLAAARAGRDGALVRRLQRWKYASRKGWGIDRERWNLALTEANHSAPTPAAR